MIVTHHCALLLLGVVRAVSRSQRHFREDKRGDMKNMLRILQAFVMVAWGHRKQKDKAGRAYLWHLLTVAWIAYGLTSDAEAVVVGLLHDYIEDVAPTAHARLVRRFGVATADRVRVLTRETTESYASYAQDVSESGDRIVIAVKIADLLHNTDGTRRYLANAGDTKRSGRTNRYLNTLQLMLTVRATTGHQPPAA
jgi:(p)ppGpp synthase/HD superfamily hydrolase